MLFEQGKANRPRWPLLVGLLSAAVASAQPARVQVLDSVVIPSHRIDGLKIAELSGLAWDMDEALLYAISDKGRVFHFELKIENGRIRGLKPVFAAALAADGPDPGGFNAEALVAINAANGVRGDTELVIALETGPRIMRFTPQGRALAELPLPSALRDASAYRGSNSRVEAITIDATHGVIAAPQRPLKDQVETLHSLYAESGARWSFRSAQKRASTIKALENADGGRLLVIERLKAVPGRAARTLLRWIDISACGREIACEAQEMAGTSELSAGDNFEGLARIAGDLYLMVSDDGFDRRPTRLVLLRVDAR